MKLRFSGRWFGIISLVSVPFAIGHAQCRPGDTLIGADAKQYYCMEASKYAGSQAETYGLSYCRAQLAVAADQAAIRTLGFATNTERFELYGEVGAERKAEFQHTALSTLFDQGLSATQAMVNSASSLNPWNVNNAARTLKDNGFDNDVVVAALRSLARQRDKPAMAAAYREFVKKLKSAKEAWETEAAISADAKNAKLRLALAALKTLQGNPELGLVITGLGFGENVAYLIYLTGRTNDLTTVNDAQLSRLTQLSERLRDHVAAVAANKRAWRQSTGYDTGTPVCGH
jgi:hypothetical protein